MNGWRFSKGKVEAHTHMVEGIREAVVSLEQRMDRRSESIDRRFDSIDSKMSRQFTWLVGILVTTLGATVTTILTR